jgi:hypothetical protein
MAQAPAEICYVKFEPPVKTQDYAFTGTDGPGLDYQALARHAAEQGMRKLGNVIPIGVDPYTIALQQYVPEDRLLRGPVTHIITIGGERVSYLRTSQADTDEPITTADLEPETGRDIIAVTGAGHREIYGLLVRKPKPDTNNQHSVGDTGPRQPRQDARTIA